MDTVDLHQCAWTSIYFAIRLFFAYDEGMGVMKRREAREEAARMAKEQMNNARFASTLVIAAAIIAAVRLAREDNIEAPTPRLLSAVHGSVSLARLILDNVIRRFPQNDYR